MATKRKSTRRVDPDCRLEGADACPGVKGKQSPYQYQMGCRGVACKSVNSEYYKVWRAKKVTKSTKKRGVPAKKKVAAKKVTKKSARTKRK